MAKHWLVRHRDSLIAADFKALAAIHRLAQGEAVLMMMERSRSPEWHRWFMGGCAAIADNAKDDEALTTHAVKEILKLKAGHFDVFEVMGVVYKVPRSIDFEKLDADEWAELFPSLDLAAQALYGFDFHLFREGPPHKSNKR